MPPKPIPPAYAHTNRDELHNINYSGREMAPAVRESATANLTESATLTDRESTALTEFNNRESAHTRNSNHKQISTQNPTQNSTQRIEPYKFNPLNIYNLTHPSNLYAAYPWPRSGHSGILEEFDKNFTRIS
jgi:hypothetical protein